MDLTTDNTAAADALADSEVEWTGTHGHVVQEELDIIPAPNRLPRPTYQAGVPDYACPKVTVENIRLSKPNVEPVLPAGIRVGDRRLPQRFEVRDQLRFRPGHVVFNRDTASPRELHLR